MDYYGVGANDGMVVNNDTAKNPGARADVDMSTQSRDPPMSHANRHLLEQQAVGADLCVRVNDDTAGVRK
jgi:hypothetical protein